MNWNPFNTQPLQISEKEKFAIHELNALIWVQDGPIGGELYSTVGVETPIETGGHPYQINGTPMANLPTPTTPIRVSRMEKDLSSPSKTTEAIHMHVIAHR